MKLILALALIFPLIGSAQVYKCNGVFSNLPCNTERPPVEIKKEVTKDKELPKKQTLLHDLTMKSIHYRKKHGIKTDISEARELCTPKESSLDECRIAVERLDAILEERRVQAMKIAAQEKNEELSKTPVIQKIEQKTVVIVNQPRVRSIPLLNRKINGIEILPHTPVAPPLPHAEPPVNPVPNPLEPSAGSIVGPK